MTECAICKENRMLFSICKTITKHKICKQCGFNMVTISQQTKCPFCRCDINIDSMYLLHQLCSLKHQIPNIKNITNKKNINLQDKNKKSPLMIASQYNNYEAVALLIENGANINDICTLKQNAIMYASEKADSFIIKLLLMNNANYKQKNINGENVLHIAAKKGNLQAIKLLIELSLVDKNFDIDEKDKNNRSALFFAVSYGHVKIVDLLINVGKSNKDIKDNFGFTSLNIAKANEYSDFKYSHIRHLLEVKNNL